jgi:hypothetical protein
LEHHFRVINYAPIVINYATRVINGDASSVNITLDGTMYPGLKLVRFILHEKTNVNKTHQLIPGIGTAILGVMEPH